MKIQSILLGVALGLCLSCEDNLQELDRTSFSDLSCLSICVATPTSNTKALITDDYLPAASELGVTVLNAEGASYDGIDYKNILFTATGSGSSQTWSGVETVYLSATQGMCYAYYPYNAEVSDITKVPVSTAGQVDYLYASPVPVDIVNSKASLTMQHALSAIRIALVRGTYTGAGVVSSVSVTSSGLGTTGLLNAKDGTLSSVTGLGSAIGVDANISLTDIVQPVDVIVVPNGSSAAITLSVAVDGQVYFTEISATKILQSTCYSYTLSVNAGELSLSGVTVGDWGYDESGAPTITAAGHTVSFSGDFANMAFINSVSGNTVTIEAMERSGLLPKAVTVSGSATWSQRVEGNRRIITLGEVSSPVTVAFSGSEFLGWGYMTDGVYYIGPDEQYTATPSSDCIGVALINHNRGQRLMIEKYEDANASYEKSHKDAGVSGTKYWAFSWGIYNQTMNELLGITDYVSYAEGHHVYDWGYLPDKKGNYYYDNGERYLGFPSDWPSVGSLYALADTAGYRQSQYLMQVTVKDEYMEHPKLGQLLKTFLASSDAMGYSDWFIPTLGQLALFYIYLTDINAALEAIEGSPLTSTASYWCCTEYDSECAWRAGLSDGPIYSTRFKYQSTRVRLVRYLSY